MTLVDWRDCSAADVAPLYAAECDRWRRAFGWDTSAQWPIVELGRNAGHVAGWIARAGDGSVEGWAFYLLDRGVLQIGGLVSARPSVARRLLDAVLASPEADLASAISCFVVDGSGVVSALARQRFATHPVLFLERPLPENTSRPADAGARSWRLDDLAPAATLLQAAYAGTPGGDLFARSGSRREWAEYVGQLVATPGCGRFDASLTRLVEDGGTLTAALLTTWIAEDSVHIAQLAVHPSLTRRGIAGRLLDDALAGAAAAGARRATLMVDERNAAARALYDARGFRVQGRFVSGQRGARRRMAA